MESKQSQIKMRVPEVEKGDGFLNRLSIRFISLVSGMRLPDAARIVMYHRKFYGDPMSAWTHAAMRGKSGWTVGERELMAAMTAKWNACPFCIDAHGAIAALELGDSIVKEVLEKTEQLKSSNKLDAAINFLKKLTLQPNDININDKQVVIDSGVTREELEDAIAVSSLFNITARCANAFNFVILNNNDLQKAAKRLLTKGYVFGKKGIPDHPNHTSMAEALRQKVFEAPGVTKKVLRKAVANRAIGGNPIDEPYNKIAQQIYEASYKVTNEDVNNIIKATGSDKAAFEIMIAAAVGSGLYRWDKAIKLLT